MSRNSVHIDITGNNIDLKNKLNDVRRDLKATSTEAQKQSNAISSALKRISATIGVGFGVSQVKGFVAELINVRSEIQSVEKSLEVLAGRQIGKRLADDIKKFAVLCSRKWFLKWLRHFWVKREFGVNPKQYLLL